MHGAKTSWNSGSYLIMKERRKKAATGGCKAGACADAVGMTCTVSDAAWALGSWRCWWESVHGVGPTTSDHSTVDGKRIGPATASSAGSQVTVKMLLGSNYRALAVSLACAHPVWCETM